MQQTFAEASFEQYRKSTRRERFLEEMNRVEFNMLPICRGL
ncbi:MAG: hypothetical protein R3B05_05830 [Nitrospira sp.]